MIAETLDRPADTAETDAEQAAGGYLAAGSPGRMAALQLLAEYPAGVPSVDIRAAIRRADARVFDEQRQARVLRLLRKAGLAATERDAAGLRWFSPGARHVAALRGTWPGERGADA